MRRLASILLVIALCRCADQVSTARWVNRCYAVTWRGALADSDLPTSFLLDPAHDSTFPSAAPLFRVRTANAQGPQWTNWVMASWSVAPADTLVLLFIDKHGASSARLTATGDSLYGTATVERIRDQAPESLSFPIGGRRIACVGS